MTKDDKILVESADQIAAIAMDLSDENQILRSLLINIIAEYHRTYITPDTLAQPIIEAEIELNKILA